MVCGMTRAEIVKAARAVWRMRQPEIARRIKSGDARRALENREIERAVGIDDCDGTVSPNHHGLVHLAIDALLVKAELEFFADVEPTEKDEVMKLARLGIQRLKESGE